MCYARAMVEAPLIDEKIDYETFCRIREERPEEWLELIDGRIVAMAPPSRRHTVLCSNLVRHIGNLLEGKPCFAYTQGAETRPPPSLFGDNAFMPDLVIECGEIDLETPTIAEPIAVFEVPSPSTAHRDVGQKLRSSSLYPSLKHYVLVHQDSRLVVHHRRENLDQPWTTTLTPSGELVLDPPGITVPIERLYARTGI